MNYEERRAANNEHVRRYRSTPEGRQRLRDGVTAGSRAMRRLAKLHPEEYAALLAEERAKLSLPNPGDLIVVDSET